jgi:hypothetical protein
MAVSGVSLPLGNNYQNSPQANFRQTFMQMVKAIKSGDLSGAQQAYATLAQMQASSQGRGADQSSPFGAALGQIGQALQNGDIAGAQQALSSLGQQLHAHHHHGHHHPSNDASSGSPSVGADAGTATIGNNVDLSA